MANRFPEDRPGWKDPSKQPRTCQFPGCEVTRELDTMIHGHVNVTAPGHGSIMPFQCGDEEHWGCSIEHFIALQHTCLDEDIQKALVYFHSDIPESVHHDYAQEHSKDKTD